MSLTSYLEGPFTSDKRGGHYNTLMDIKLCNALILDVALFSNQCSKGTYGHYMPEGKSCLTCGTSGGTIQTFIDQNITIYDGADESFSNPHTITFTGKCLETLFSCTVAQSTDAKYVKQCIKNAKSRSWMLLVYKSESNPIVVKVKELCQPETWRSADKSIITDRAAKRTRGWR